MRKNSGHDAASACRESGTDRDAAAGHGISRDCAGGPSGSPRLSGAIRRSPGSSGASSRPASGSRGIEDGCRDCADGAQEAGPCPRVQTHGLRLPRRIRNVHATPPHPGQSHRGSRTRRRDVEQQSHRQFQRDGIGVHGQASTAGFQARDNGPVPGSAVRPSGNRWSTISLRSSPSWTAALYRPSRRHPAHRRSGSSQRNLDRPFFPSPRELCYGPSAQLHDAQAGREGTGRVAT